MLGDRRRQILLTALIASIILVTTGDMIFDADEGSDMGHISVEIVLVLLCIFAIGVIWKDSLALGRNIETLSNELKMVKQDAQHWRAEAAQLIRGISSMIDKQFSEWKLTAAEKDVGFLLLKGLSFKEIAEIRGASERTVRQQAQEIYAKSGVAGRAEFSAFFLEDLLPPIKAQI